MTDPRAEFIRYLAQRSALGETRLVAEERRVVETIMERKAATTSRQRSSAVAPVSTTEKPRRDEKGSARRSRASSRAETSEGRDREPDWRRGAPSIPPPGMEVPAPSTNLFSDDPLAGKSLDELREVILTCSTCRLCEERANAVPGEGPPDARLMVIGEGPGAKEDETGRPFVGRAGELLTDILAAIDCPRETVFIGNVVKCRPPNNRNPERDEIDACVPYLYRQIEAIRPSVILAMGATAASTLLNARGSLASLRNKVHRFRGIPLVVTYHPAALLRNPNWKKPTWDDVRIARRLLAGDG